MAEKVTIRLDSQQTETLDQITDDGEADNTSEALRTALNAGFCEMGYLNGEKKETPLRAISRRFADAFSLLGLFWIGLTYFFPLGFRAIVIPVFGVAVGLYAFDRVLATYEPAVSRRLVGLFRGESA